MPARLAIATAQGTKDTLVDSIELCQQRQLFSIVQLSFVSFLAGNTSITTNTLDWMCQISVRGINPGTMWHEVRVRHMGGIRGEATRHAFFSLVQSVHIVFIRGKQQQACSRGVI